MRPLARPTTPVMQLAQLLLWFCVVLGCAIAIGQVLSLAERPDGSTSFDSSITSWMVVHRSHGLTSVARLFSTLGSQAVLLPVVVVIALILLWRRALMKGGLLLLTWSVPIGLYSLVKFAVSRPRPPMDLWLTKVAGTSFPSGHATQSLSTFLALALVLVCVPALPRARAAAVAIAVVLAAGVGWSRVYLGVHWSTDVAAGWMIAAAWVAVVRSLVARHISTETPVHP